MAHPWIHRALCLLLLVIAGIGCDRRSKPARIPTAHSRPARTSLPANVSDAVIKIVADQMGVKAAELKRQTRLTEDLKADELDLVELVMDLEDAFKLSIPDNDAKEFKTIGQMIDYVSAHVPASQVMPTK